MSINNYVMMACDCCGEALKIDSQNYWETDDCARSEAEDEGWSCYNGGGEDKDYCPKCVATKIVTLITLWPGEHCEGCAKFVAGFEYEYPAHDLGAPAVEQCLCVSCWHWWNS